MEHSRNGGRTRATAQGDGHPHGKRPHSRNRQWISDAAVGSRSGTSAPPPQPDGQQRRERSGNRVLVVRGRGSPRGGVAAGTRMTRNAAHTSRPFSSHSIPPYQDDEDMTDMEEEQAYNVGEPELETQEEREKFWQELVKSREIERKTAIAEGKMDDPLVPKRLEDAITMVGTCMDMCPRFERYRRERENNLFDLECVPGTKRVDHKRAVKMYERAAGDKILPSDLRPPVVLLRTLDYLFHDLLPQYGLPKTAAFIRDRSRAVRNDFTMQHETGPIAMECHDRCVRFHLLTMHLERNRRNFDCDMEEQQLMNALQSLKEFYEDQRGRYESSTELEMRVYHRLIHIRDQKERYEAIPDSVTNHPAFKLTTKFRLHVQARSAPITKKSALVVDAQAMSIFAELADVLREMGNKVMCYLVACILERLFGQGTVEDMEAIRGNLSLPDIIDGVSDSEESEYIADTDEVDKSTALHSTLISNGTDAPYGSSVITATSPPPSVFGQPSHASLPPASATSIPSVPGPGGTFTAPAVSAFSGVRSTNLGIFGAPSVFGRTEAPSTSSASAPFGSFRHKPSGSDASDPPRSVFGGPTFVTGTSASNAPQAPPLFSSPTLGATSSAFGTSPFAVSVFARPQLTNGNLTVAGQSAEPRTAPRTDSFSIRQVDMNVRPVGTTTNVPKAPVFLPTVGATPTTLIPKVPAFIPSSSSIPPTTRDDKPNGSSTSLPRLDKPPPPPSDSTNLPGTTTPEEPSALGLVHSAHQPPPATVTQNSLFSTAKPATTRPAPVPLLPKIITSSLDTSVRSKASPREPPPLKKPVPISLPPTPSDTLCAIPTNLGLPSPAYLRTPASTETLSPLLVSTPTTARPLIGVPSVVLEPPRFAPAPQPPVAEQIAPARSKRNLAQIEESLVALCRRGWLVHEYFERWKQRTMDRAEWAEACRQSEAYKLKVVLQRSLSGSSAAAEKKRRNERSAVIESPIRKRAKRRSSSLYHPPMSDEQLAQRLRKNQDENQRRWAQGSFLGVLRSFVRRLSAKHDSTAITYSDWSAWLSTNPDNDGTAIWLECKFDVPASGDWESEHVFSIPLSDGRHSTRSPGIIIFECTSLQGVTDTIERKYHILDDCARLRDIVQALPSKRHFMPSLLLISWEEDEQASLHPDLLETIPGPDVIGNHHVLTLTSSTPDLDSKFEEALALLKLDVQGTLVEALNLKGVLMLSNISWQDFTAECVDCLPSGGSLVWSLLVTVLETAVEFLNTLGYHLSTLLENEVSFEPLTSPQFNVTNPQSAFKQLVDWLASLGNDAAAVMRDLQSYRTMGSRFPLEIVLDGLYQLLLHRVRSKFTEDPFVKLLYSKTSIALATREWEDKRETLARNLRRMRSLRAMRSPRPLTESVSTSKRVRTSSQSSVDSIAQSPSPGDSPMIVNDRLSPTPSIISVSTAEEKPIITAAMLRALTKDIKRRYVR